MASWALHQQHERQIIRDIEAVERVDVEAVEEPADGDIWRVFHTTNQFVQNTNFTEVEMTDLVRATQPYILAERRRGQKPKSTWADALICYVVWAHYGADYAVAARAAGMKEGRFEDNVGRARTVLRNSLRSRWWSPRHRPTPVADSPWPHVALLVDTNTTEVFRPRARSEEAKIYWDDNNKIYGIKKEVAVMASAPYYCVMTHKGFVGAIHDYDEHKRNVQSYEEYLLKTEEEARALPQDRASRFWALMADLGYLGPDADTAPIRRVTPTRSNQSVHDAHRNTDIARRCNPIEWFFGRLWRSWTILRNVYRWNHAHFDDDYDICCLLTNELIRATQLNEADHDFYVRVITKRRLVCEDKERARKAQQLNYKHTKHARLEGLAMPYH